MTTPRIEEMVEKYAESYRGILPPEVIDKSKDYWRSQLQEAHQVGIDEAVEVMESMKRKRNMEEVESLYEMNSRTLYNQALDDTIKALQDNK